MTDNQTKLDPERIRTNASRWFAGLLRHRGHELPEPVMTQVWEFYTDYVLWTYGLGQKPKGLIVFGPIGAGKTTLCEDLVYGMKRCRRSEQITILRARRMAEDYAQFDDYLDWLRRVSRADVMLDDLGAEGSSTRYGVTWSMADYIDDRYIAWRERQRITLITTNLTGLEEIAERYGHRAESRIREMVTPIVYAHPDRRPVWE